MWLGFSYSTYCIIFFTIEQESGQYYEECQKSSSSYRACSIENQDELWETSMKMIMYSAKLWIENIVWFHKTKWKCAF